MRVTLCTWKCLHVSTLLPEFEAVIVGTEISVMRSDVEYRSDTCPVPYQDMNNGGRDTDVDGQDSQFV